MCLVEERTLRLLIYLLAEINLSEFLVVRGDKAHSKRLSWECAKALGQC